MKKSNKIEVWSDGSSLKKCKTCEAKGAWAFIILVDGREAFRQSKFYETGGTIGKMELLGAFKGLLYAYTHFDEIDLTLYCDSQYIVKGLTTWMHNWSKRGWKKANSQEKIEHEKLWKDFHLLDNLIDGTYKWVRGHNGTHWNEEVDKLANTTLKMNI